MGNRIRSFVEYVESEWEAKEKREAEDRYLRFRREVLVSKLDGLPVLLAERLAASVWPDLDPLAFRRSSHGLPLQPDLMESVEN